VRGPSAIYFETMSLASSANGILPADAVAAAFNDGKTHLLLAASGSVATIKIPLIIQSLGAYHTKLSIRLILSSSAAHFLAGQAAEQPSLATIAALPCVDAIYQDADESGESWTRGAGILHINLRKWADMMVVAPLSANTLAKIVNGISDSLLTDVIRAWDTTGLVDGGRRKRIVVAPAMNAAMWLHPITGRQIRVLQEDWGVKDGEGDEPAEVDGEGLVPSPGWFEVLNPIEVCFPFLHGREVHELTVNRNRSPVAMLALVGWSSGRSS
jgi:phosphopantothenoylcysteine decarboxylase